MTNMTECVNAEHFSQILEHFRDSRRTGFQTDVRLYGNQSKISAHSIVLSSVSPVFQMILSSRDLHELDDTVVIFPDVTGEDLETAINGIYEGCETPRFVSAGVKEIIDLLEIENEVKSEDIEVKVGFPLSDPDFDPESDPDEEEEEFLSKRLEKKRKKENPITHYLCSVCDFKSGDAHLITQHIKEVHEKMDYEQSRPEATHRASKFQAKVKSQTAGLVKRTSSIVKSRNRTRPPNILTKTLTELYCRFCERKFKTKHQRRTHIGMVHKKELKHEKDLGIDRKSPKSTCEACSRRHTDPTCCICGKVYALLDTCRRHIRYIHLHPDTYKCQDCGVSFDRQAVLDKHRNSMHLKLKNYICDVCGQAFGNQQLLRSHIGNMHEKSDDRHACQKCGEKFKHYFTLKNHYIREHATEEEKEEFKAKLRRVCQECGKTLYDSKALKKHLTHVHRKIRAFKCRICLGDFVTKQSMQMHVRNVHKTNSE